MRLDCSDSEVQNLMQGVNEMTKESLQSLIDGVQFDKEELYMDVYKQLMIEKNGNLEHDRINEVKEFIVFYFKIF